jgi:hypothetical protein
MALLDETDWGSQHELTFSLWRERAECEILSGNFVKAQELVVELLERGASNVEFADASCLKIHLHTLKAEYPQAVESALTCLRQFGIDLPAHPTWEQVQAEHETVWQTLGGRPIESLIDLPLMSDPELQAAMQVLSALIVPAYHADFHSFCVLACRHHPAPATLHRDPAGPDRHLQQPAGARNPRSVEVPFRFAGSFLRCLAANQATLDYFGLTLEEWLSGDLGKFTHRIAECD